MRPKRRSPTAAKFSEPKTTPARSCGRGFVIDTYTNESEYLLRFDGHSLTVFCRTGIGGEPDYARAAVIGGGLYLFGGADHRTVPLLCPPGAGKRPYFSRFLTESRTAHEMCRAVFLDERTKKGYNICMYIDTHAHLNYTDRYGDLGALMERIAARGVGKVINVGWDFASSESAARMACEYAACYFAAGFHPSDIGKAKDGDLDRIANLLSRPKGVALGEIGLDYHYDNTDECAQKHMFCAQLELADACGVPVVIHSRDAAKDTLAILRENRHRLQRGGVMHCYSGSADTAKEYLRLGLYISFAGPVTFKNARRLDEAARMVPADRILAETDSPYLAPEPLRGTQNTPENVPLVYAKLAELRGESPADLAAQICKNAHTLFLKLNDR